ncbi:hypothetical protein B0J17DRAFT_628049 [Rhizoctonia solani]|nr:hypothetical protein B0J17DRAFT_628049 [Rhizoctonia solani]
MINLLLSDREEIIPRPGQESEANQEPHIEYGMKPAQEDFAASHIDKSLLNESPAGMKRGVPIELLPISTRGPYSRFYVRVVRQEAKYATPRIHSIRTGNLQVPGIRNYAVLDRNMFSRANLISSTRQSDSTAARDEFRFSCDGDQKELLKRCKLTPHYVIEIIRFLPAGSLPLYKLAIIALATSLKRDHYHLIDANSYWFAGLVWEHILQMYPKATHEILRDGVRGTFGRLFKFVPNVSEQDEIEEKVQELISQIGSGFTGTFLAGAPSRISPGTDADKTKARSHPRVSLMLNRSSLPLRGIAILAQTLAGGQRAHRPRTDGYWFSGLIWDCVLRMRPSASYKVVQGRLWGVLHGWLRHSTNISDLEETYRLVYDELFDIEKSSTVKKQQWAQSRGAEIKDDLEAMRKRIRSSKSS